MMKKPAHTVFVTLCDTAYFWKAQLTIQELRRAGEWYGEVVLITVDFDAPEEFLEMYSVQQYRIRHIDTSLLLTSYEKYPLSSDDNRHVGKLSQWDKFYVFSEYFRKWDRVLFMDAGMRIYTSIHILFTLPWQGKLVAPSGGDPYSEMNRLATQIRDKENPEAARVLYADYPKDLFSSHKDFLNGIFIYDTALLDKISMADMICAMNKYPLCGNNEMTIMNLLFNIKLNVWERMPQKIGNRYLFNWSDRNFNRGEHVQLTDFVCLKYPSK
jgi:hypothetical protein